MRKSFRKTVPSDAYICFCRTGEAFICWWNNDPIYRWTYIVFYNSLVSDDYHWFSQHIIVTKRCELDLSLIRIVVSYLSPVSYTSRGAHCFRQVHSYIVQGFSKYESNCHLGFGSVILFNLSRCSVLILFC